MHTFFSQDTINFLEKLQKNNRRDWFNAHKEEYEQFVREPAFALIHALENDIKAISPNFTAIAKKNGGSLMRVYRDIRYSKDKSPYKSYIGIHFKHLLAKGAHTPAFYLHIHPDECFLGVGCWQPESVNLHKIRDYMIDNPNSWRLTINDKKFCQYFQLSGNRLKRPPRGFPTDHPLIEDLKRKDFIAIHHFPLKQALAKDFDRFIAQRFQAGAGLVEWLCDACDFPFQ